MRQERSQQNNRSSRAQPYDAEPGTLYVIGVPIGSPDDLSLRARTLLRRVEVVATEDPQATQRLLSHHRITATLTSYGPTHIEGKVRILIDRLKAGASVALVSDCGMPVISDPGDRLIAAAHQEEIPIRSIPGPSAATAALAASGFPADAFHLYGSLPSRRDALARRLPDILAHTHPVVLLCPPGSAITLLAEIARSAPRRQLAVACNLSLPTESLYRGSAKQVCRRFAHTTLPDATTLVIAGQTKKKRRTHPRSG